MAQKVAQVVAPAANQILLWRTSTGVAPDPTPAAGSAGAGPIIQAGTVNDPVPIIITNEDSTNTCYLGGSGVTGPTNGTPLAAGASITRNVIGNDSEFVAGDGNTVDVSLEYGRQ
jgi:hypothetical protein